MSFCLVSFGYRHVSFTEKLSRGSLLFLSLPAAPHVAAHCLIFLQIKGHGASFLFCLFGVSCRNSRMASGSGTLLSEYWTQPGKRSFNSPQKQTPGFYKRNWEPWICGGRRSANSWQKEKRGRVTNKIGILTFSRAIWAILKRKKNILWKIITRVKGINIKETITSKSIVMMHFFSFFFSYSEMCSCC